MGLGSPHVAELLGAVGFDWLIIECEHNAVDIGRVEHMLMAIQGTGAVPIVRLPSADPVWIQRALDVGAMGIIVPLVRSAAEARAIVAATRYPPAGKRSYGGLRASRYTLQGADYFEQANDNLIVMLILETREAVEDLENIMRVEGVDAIYMGPMDLSLSLGLNPLAQPHPEVEAIIDRTIALGKILGVGVGSVYGSAEQLKAHAERGFTLLGFTDYLLLAGAAKHALGTVRG